MIQINEIIKYYQKFTYTNEQGYLHKNFFLKQLLFNYCSKLNSQENLNGKFNTYWLQEHIKTQSNKKEWNHDSQILKNYFNKCGKLIKMKLVIYPEFIIGHFIESLCAFERSIFWFFNYKHNLDPFNQIASDQSIYYSEFFSIIAITKLLGGSLVHTPVGHFKVALDWEGKIITIKFPAKIGKGQHDAQIKLLTDVLERIDLSDQDYLLDLKEGKFYQKKGFLMKEDRVENVYDLTSATSDPFKNALEFDLHESYITILKSRNFLDPKNTSAEYLQREPDDQELIETHIGEYWKLILTYLKKVNNTKEYFKRLKWKLSRYDNCLSVKIDSNTKNILFKWIETLEK